MSIFTENDGKQKVYVYEMTFDKFLQKWGFEGDSEFQKERKNAQSNYRKN